MFAEHEAAVRADFARCGWSLQTDLGSRLRYADALALLTALANDTTSAFGAELAGLRYPASMADAIAITQAVGKDSRFGPVDVTRGTRHEFKDDRAAKDARSNMSPLFRGL